MFENAFSPQHPDHPGLHLHVHGHGRFGTDVVALRHEGPLGDHVKTLAEILGDEGYNTTCVGFSGNPASRGFQNTSTSPAGAPGRRAAATRPRT